MLRKKHFILYKIIRLPAIAVDVDSCRCYRLKALTKSCECLAFVPPVVEIVFVESELRRLSQQRADSTWPWLQQKEHWCVDLGEYFPTL